MIDITELQERVVGWQFPGSKVRVEDYERWLAADSMLSPPLPDGVLHPAWIFIAGFRGMGVPLEGLMELVAATVEEGVMFGETTIEQVQPLRVDEEYQIGGEIVSVERRQGKRIGTFDVLTFRMEVSDSQGVVRAAATNSFVFPRSA